MQLQKRNFCGGHVTLYFVVYMIILLPNKSLPIPRPVGNPPNNGGVVVLVDVLGALPGGCVDGTDGVG